MATGKTKWFNNAKGFGFITPDDGSEEVFVHYSAIRAEGFRTLKPRDAVEYQVVRTERGLHAVDLIPLGKSGSAHGSAGGDSREDRQEDQERQREEQLAAVTLEEQLS